MARHLCKVILGATSIYAATYFQPDVLNLSWLRNIPSTCFNHAFAASAVPNTPIKPWDYKWDNASFSNSSEKNISNNKPKYNRHILLVRHGQYHFAQEDADCHLTSLGHEQTSLTGERLKHLNFPYSRIVYSTMTRAVESAEEIIKHLPNVPAVPCDYLQEGAPFPPEPPVPNWPTSPDAYTTDGPRIESAFQRYIHRATPDQTTDTYEIFVCHANVIRYFTCRSLQIPPEAWIRMSLDHGSITWITIRPSGNVSLRWLGNSGYMPPNKLSLQ